MQQELTPKQQAVELLKQANHILLVTGQNPNNDQLSAMVALDLVLKRAGKQVSAIVSGQMPKAAQILDTKHISRDLQGIRDFVIRLDTSQVEVDKLKYENNDGNLEVVISPFSGNFSSDDVSFDYGEYKFDLVVVLGVSQISGIDQILEQNPTLFDGLHLINIDSKRSNELYGSVNFVESHASSVCEMLVGVLDSVAQGMIDYHVATALLTGIMSSTQGFTGPNTTAKSMTIAAQMLSAGAKQQDIVLALFQNNRNANGANTSGAQKGEFKVAQKPTEKKQKTETIAEKLARKGEKFDKENGEIITTETLEDETKDYDAKADSRVEDEKSVKKFKNPKGQKKTKSHQATSKGESAPDESRPSKKK